MSQRSLLSRFWYEFLRLIVKNIAVSVFHVRYSGVKNIPSQGGVLVVSNHQSHFDPPLIGLGSSRRLNYLARDTLFRYAPFRWLIKSLDAIPIDREGIGLAGIKQSLKRLKQGEIVLIFPEGTRTPDGQIKTFRPGFTSLAVRSRAAILPAAIEGAYQCWPKSRLFPRPGKIYVCYGQPILPREYEDMDERDLLVLVEKRIRQCHAELLRRPTVCQKPVIQC
jgi:1-acyl-sn-glycerol-3-phosphate acyltransferase